MPSSFLLLLIGSLGVVMVTSAPLSSQEKLVNVDQEEESIDRAKRAEEEIVFGNQQNKARVIAKKSDLSNAIAPGLPEGEQDQGAEVIVYKERPVEEDLAARAEATSGGTDEKMAEAVEEAMHSVADAEEAETEAEGNEQEAEEETAEDEQMQKQLVEEEIDEDGAGEVVAEAEEEKAEEDEEEEEDLKELERVASGQAEEEAELAAVEEGSDEAANVPLPELQDEEVGEFLKELQQSEEANGNDNANDQAMRDYYQNLYQYMSFPYNHQVMPQRLPYMYYRARRSLANSHKELAPSSNKPARRIKRDLLDDSYYDPYAYPVPYSPVEDNDPLLADPDELVPLTDDEAEYLYNRLVNYLATSNGPEEMNPYQDTPPVDPFLGNYEELQNELYTPYEITNDVGIPEVSSPYDDDYPYGPVDLDTYNSYSKRGYYNYYPQQEEKRYFFPFNDEPETHWGAFVPEKRDYGEAIQRLQRLAMALSDNPGPYYQEMLEDYRRK